MRETTLMQQALGLTPPWTVVRSDFDTKAGRLDVQIDFPPGSRFACPTCGAADCLAYDTQRKTFCAPGIPTTCSTPPTATCASIHCPLR